MLSIGLLACSSIPFERGEAPVELTDRAVFLETWQGYVADVMAVPRQPDCAPRLYPAKPDIDRRGTVLMIHGFSGCPQQLFELAWLISERGFDVLLPLLPGHGMQPGEQGADDLAQLPDAHTWTRYPELAARMNEIMAYGSGTKVVVGFSLGGAIGINVILQAPDLYDRVLLLAPMLAIRGGAVVEGVAEALGRTPGLQNMVVKTKSDREQCYAWQAAGRAGFCDYRYEHAVALVELEDLNRDMHRERPLTVRAQLVGVGDEKYVSNGRLQSFTERQRKNGPIELCFLPDDVPHEMLTPYENVEQEMYWLQDLLQRSVEFVVNDEFFPVQRKDDQDQVARLACLLTQPVPRPVPTTMPTGN